MGKAKPATRSHHDGPNSVIWRGLTYVAPSCMYKYHWWGKEYPLEGKLGRLHVGCKVRSVT